MDRNEIKIDGTRILLSLFEKYKNQPWVLSSSEIENKKKSWFSGKWGDFALGLYKHKFGLKSGITISEYDYMFFLVDAQRSVYRKFETLEDIRGIFHIHNSTSIKINYVWENCYIKMTEPEIQFLQEFLNNFSLEVDKEIENIQNKEKKVKENEKHRLESLKKSQTSLLQEFDKDGNGVVDTIEGIDEFMILFKKHLLMRRYLYAFFFDK